MLDALELSDRPTELLPDPGVLRGGPGRPVGESRGLGSEEGRRQVERKLWVDVEDVGGGDHAVQPDLAEAPGEVVARAVLAALHRVTSYDDPGGPGVGGDREEEDLRDLPAQRRG